MIFVLFIILLLLKINLGKYFNIINSVYFARTYIFISNFTLIAIDITLKTIIYASPITIDSIDII